MTLDATASPKPPTAEMRPVAATLHGENRTDEYGWMRDRSDPRVIAHLEAENTYTDSVTEDSKAFQSALFDEMLGRIQQTDLSVPYAKGDWLYYTRTIEGQQYPVHCRKRGSADAAEHVILDVNALAEGHTFMAVGDFEVCPDGRLLAYTTDSTGYRQYVLHVRDLESGTERGVSAERVTSIAWAADGHTLLYTQEDEVTKRSHRLYRTTVDGVSHTLVTEEADERFSVTVGLTRSGEWIIFAAGSHTTSEASVLPAAKPSDAFVLVAPRRQNIEYDLDHRGDRFWIRVSDRGREFRLVTAPVITPGPDHWVEVLPHRDTITLGWVACFEDHIVLGEREDALPHLVVLDPSTHERRRVRFDEAAYLVSMGVNEQFSASRFRYTYQSFVTPSSVFDLDLATLGSTLLKRQPVLGGYDGSRYVIERLAATAADGASVPITLLYAKGTPRDGSAPCLLYGYGAYGISGNVAFSPSRFSLVDRGVVYAIAHIRGGADRGQKWHDDGRMAKKMNSFTDFIACGEHLVSERITSSDRMVIQGGSAGGLLMGAVVNLRPDLWKGVLTQVPFVDVVHTMLDDQLPLTVGEYEEWGDPRNPEHYGWIRAYSPYDNLAKREYPAMLVKTGLNDSQVGFWEPAKYVARLRTLKTDRNPLLFRINMGAGHGGASGRYDALREVAFDYAWILTTLGRQDANPAR